MDFTLTFIGLFFRTLSLVSPIVAALLAVIAGIGLWIGRSEKWPASDALYFAFITATTVGYGDIRPSKKTTKYAAISIALTGLLLTGIIVATGLQSLEIAFTQHYDMEQIRSMFESNLKITD